MNKIEQLTINGVSYAVADPRIADGDVGQWVWSSGAIAQRLLPRLRLDGAVASQLFLPGSALRLQASFAYAQEGQGKAAPDNLRPITGAKTLQVRLGAENQVTVDLGQEVFGGSYDHDTGILTLTWKAVALKDLTWSKWDPSVTTKHIFGTADLQGKAQYVINSQMTGSVATMYRPISMNDLLKNENDLCFALGLNQKATLVVSDQRCDSLEKFLALAGDCMFVYELLKPETIQLSAQPLVAQGECQVVAQNAAVTLEGYAHGGKLLLQLMERISALESNRAQEV